MVKKKAKVATKKCVKCGVWDQAGIHLCPLVSCRNCKSVYGKKGSAEFTETHRCILWKEEKDPDKVVKLKAGDALDGKKFAVLAYDFETTIQKSTSGKRKMIRTFKRTDDGKFPMHEDFLPDVNGLLAYQQGFLCLMKGYIPRDDVEYTPDENGFFSWEEGLVKLTKGYNGNEIYDTTIHDTTHFISEKHVVNYVSCKNYETGEKWYFQPREDGIDPLHQFLSFAKSYNKGNNIFAAHNGSGYDTKFILYHVRKHFLDEHIDVIMRGQKILSLKLGGKTRSRLRFIDTLNHLPGSLKSLGKDFCKGENGLDDLMKGYFPHKFNVPQNYMYEGKLPGKEMYDIFFSARTEKDIREFDVWWEAENLKYDGVRKKWNFNEQMKYYCDNDVELLCMIMKKLDDQSPSCPWLNVTGPSYEHERSLIGITKLLKEDYRIEEVREEQGEAAVTELINELAKNETWAVLKPVEYAPVKKAFQGGRTEALAFHATLTEEEIRNGVHFRAVDVVSMYPAQQIKEKFPVGLPKIRVWDKDYRLCMKDECANNLKRVKCYHGDSSRKMNDVKYVMEEGEVTAAQILEEDWHGYVCVTVQPCKMRHPVLGFYDEVRQKSVYSCEKIKEEWYDTPSLKLALKNGYKLEKVHAFHQYKLKDSLWRERTCELFIGKLINGGNEPEDLEGLARKYDEAFDTDFGDLIRDTRGKWGSRPAQRQVCKIRINCGWGKHAELVRKDETSIINPERDTKMYSDMVLNAHNGVYQMKSSIAFGEEKRMYRFEKKDEKSVPDLHGGYLAAAAWVPAYGRIQLWNEMDRVERTNPGVTPRVVNLDTDSMYYKYYPEDKYPGVYNVHEGGMLGDWEREDFDEENGGIIEFIGLAPKTYTFKCFNGVVPKIKTKGVRLGYCTETLVNFETFKQLGDEMISNVREMKKGHVEKKMRSLQVPQTGFVSKVDGVFTERFYKRLAVNKLKDQKGEVEENGFIRPYGWEEAPERVII